MRTGTDSQVLKRLETWEGPLPQHLEFYRRLLTLQSEVRGRIGRPALHLDNETASQRIGHGEPLLRFDDLVIDWMLLGEALSRVVDLVASYPDVFALPPDFTESIASPGLLKEAARDWFEGPSDGAPAESGVVAGFVLGAAFKPFLACYAEALDFVDTEQWRRGYCPVCGGQADFAFLDETGARRLMCSRCDARWLFQRLECPACGNSDAATLAYFTDDSGRYRLYVCERCHGYLKVVDLRRAGGEVLLPLERYLTLDLDAQAQKDGYLVAPHRAI